jgi:uncharacterized membrane protein
MMNGFGPGVGYGYSGMMGGGWLGFLLTAVIGALIVAGVVLLVMWGMRSAMGRNMPGHGPGPSASPDHDEAVAITRRRLASGEITKDQYDELMRALNG